MRAIEKKMIEAIIAHRNYNGGNTRVVSNSENSTVFLFDFPIAEINNKIVKINNQGFKTATTKSRLNAILKVFCNNLYIYQRNFTWMITEEKEIDLHFQSNIWLEFANTRLLNSFAICFTYMFLTTLVR